MASNLYEQFKFFAGAAGRAFTIRSSEATAEELSDLVNNVPSPIEDWYDDLDDDDDDWRGVIEIAASYAEDEVVNLGYKHNWFKNGF